MDSDSTSSHSPLPCHDPLRDTVDLHDPSAAIDSHQQAWRRLIDHNIPEDGLSSLIETIFSDRKAAEVVDRLRRSDARVFIDVIYEVRRHIIYLRRID